MMNINKIWCPDNRDIGYAMCLWPNQPENQINVQQFWFSHQGYFLFRICSDHVAQVVEIMNHVPRTQVVV